MSDIRVADTATIKRIADACWMHQFDRKLDRDLLRRLDPSGHHVLAVTQRNHVGTNRQVAHHRVAALLKVLNQRDPAVTLVDVSASIWGDLMSATDAIHVRDLMDQLNG